MNTLICPNCGSTNCDLHYDDINQTKYHFHCHECNLMRENTVSINHSIEEIVKQTKQ